MKKGEIILGLFGFLILAFAIFKLVNNANKVDSPKTENADSLMLEVDSIRTIQEELPPLEFKWKKYESVDEMTGKKMQFATLRSMNSINQEFPYDGDTYMKITIRKGSSTDIYFSIDRGQIQCSEYNGTNRIYAKFGDEKPIPFFTIEAQSGSSEIIFLNGNIKMFIDKCRKNKEFKIQMPIYKYGQAVFNFYLTDPLEW